MGRLVIPLTQEEYEKLPKWKKWVSRNGHWVVIGFLLFFIVVIATIKFFGAM